MIKNEIIGLIAAPYTGMNNKGDLDLGSVPAYANLLKKMNLKGAFVAGTTGEGMLLSDSERISVIEAWISQRTKGFSIIAHAGSTSLTSAKWLARESARAGADAISIMGPNFLNQGGVDDLVEFCREVAVSAPELPFYYYHIPSLSGVNISMSSFLEKAEPRIPNLAGIKFTDSNLMEMSKCLAQDGGKWTILHGCDELLLAGLAFGAKGGVGSTYNYMAPLYYDLINDFEKGNIEGARRKQLKANAIIEILFKYKGAIVAGKAIMGFLGIDCGSTRKPLQSLNPNEVQELHAELSEIGFFDLVSSFTAKKEVA